jgi:hypothetical protein
MRRRHSAVIVPHLLSFFVSFLTVNIDSITMASKKQQNQAAPAPGLPKWAIPLGLVAALWALCSWADSIVVSTSVMRAWDLVRNS